jgi:hypothetical protein
MNDKKKIILISTYASILTLVMIYGFALSPTPLVSMYVGRFDSTFHYYVTVKIYHHETGVWVTLFSGRPNLLTTNGKNYIKEQLGNSAVGNSSVAKYISLSASGSAPDVSWTQLPSEIANNNLSRVAGDYASTGDGTWTIHYLFTSTGTVTVTLIGLNHASSGDGNLVSAYAFGVVATMGSGDKLDATWSNSVA